VAHERSFTRAAAQVSLSQPSVSHRVALLETEAGVRLFDRGRDGLRLTPAGEMLLEHADRVAWRLQLADAQIAALAGDRRHQVRVGSFPTALAGFVPSAVGRLRRAQGDLRIQLSEVPPDTLEQRFLSGELDVAVAYQDAITERREFEGARRIDLFQDRFLVGLPPEHAHAAGTRAPRC
jgi:DNA-binding transcriptional LysR family regulator